MSGRGNRLVQGHVPPVGQIEHGCRERHRADHPVAEDVVDQRGRIVRSLVSEHPGLGWQQAVWDGRDHAGRRTSSGQYFARLDIDGVVKVQKMVLLK